MPSFSFPEVISSVAIIVSAASLSLSFYVAFRDRANIKTSSEFWPGAPDDVAGVRFTVVNAGRRPIILRMWGGTNKEGNGWVGTHLGKDQSGLRLGEHERFERTLLLPDLYHYGPEGEETVFADLWVEDTLGRRLPIKDAKKNVELLLKS